MSERRQKQLGELVHEELSQLVLYGAGDPSLDEVTITGVDISPDYRHATVYFTVLGEETSRREARRGLERAKSYLRRELAQGVSLRYVPELNFKYDRTMERAERIEALLEQIQQEREERGDAEPDE